MVNRLIGSSLKNSPKSILLLGPRQVGKSTLLHSLQPDLEINLADQSEFLRFSSNPGELAQRLDAILPKSVFLDEVQRLPSVLNTVQALIDKPSSGDKIKFYLSGSSARKLKRGGANLLPGRVFVYHIGPLASCELNYEMNTRKGIEIGFLPEVYFSGQLDFQKKLLSSYSATYLAEEIQAEALTRNLEGFSRFIYIAAENSGKFLDITKIANRAKISRQSCSRFYEILEDTLVATKVLPCSFVEGAELVRHPKYFFFDIGVLNGLLGNFVASPDRIGFLAEHLIFNQLLQSAFAKDKKIEISNFRTRGGLEIDFIVKLENDVWALEVKSHSDLSSSDVQGLKRFAEFHGSSYQSAIVTLDGVPKKIEGIWVLPWQMLLKEMGL